MKIDWTLPVGVFGSLALAFFAGWHFRQYVIPGFIIVAAIVTLVYTVPKLFNGPRL